MECKAARGEGEFEIFSDSVNSTERDQAATRVKEVENSLETWKTNFIKENFSSYIALVLYNYRRDFQIDTLKKLYSALPAELTQSKFGKSINTQINYPKPGLGDNYNNFEAINTSGNSFKLSEIKDKYILLQFAGTGCYWSHMSMPEIRRLSREYRDSISFVSYFMDDKTPWLNTSEADSIAWLSVWSKGTKYSDACSKYAVTGPPTFVMISPDKRVVSTWFGNENGIVEKEIKKVLAK